MYSNQDNKDIDYTASNHKDETSPYEVEDSSVIMDYEKNRNEHATDEPKKHMNRQPDSIHYVTGIDSSHKTKPASNYSYAIGNKVYYSGEASKPGTTPVGQASELSESESDENSELKPSAITRFFRNKWISVICLALVFGLVAGTAFWGIGGLFSSNGNSSTGGSSIANTRTLTSSVGSIYDVSEIVYNALPSVVSITNNTMTEIRTFWGNYAQESTSNGSGIIIGKNAAELLIVTNYHVVANSNSLNVIFSFNENLDEENVIKGIVKGYASDKDLAVVAVRLSDIPADARSQIKIATLGDSSALKLGEPIIAIGNALGYGQSVTNGIISALNREVVLTGSNNTTISNRFIQTNAAINPGNSGGALLNMKGELIGINSAKVSDDSVEGMGYAIPISDVSSIINDLSTKETRSVVAAASQGYLGISGSDVTQSASKAYGIPIGVYIAETVKNIGADKAGLAKGCVIIAIDGYSVSNMSDLTRRLKYYSAGETVEVVAQVPKGSSYEKTTFSVKLITKAQAGAN